MTKYLLLFFVSFWQINTYANDACVNAIQLTPTLNCVTTSGTFSGATLDGAAPSCANQATQDVWYKFTATEQTMSIFIERQTTSSQIFLAFEIYEDSCTGNQFKCIAPSQVYVNYFNTDFIIGRTYYIRVVNPTNTITTSGFNICLQALPKPANDTCANATQLNPTSNCVTTSGTFSGALLDGAAPSCANQVTQDVWYKFTATEQTMSIFIERPTTNSTIFLAFEIYENSCTGNQFKCIAPSQVYVNYFNTDFIIGRTYYIRVVNPTNTITTSGFNICLQALPKPANDTCANATQLNPTSNCVTTSGTFSGALLDGAAPSCANQASQDVWYKFTATEQTMSIFIERPTTSSQIFLAFEIYEDSCTGNQFKCIAPSQVYVNYFNTDFIIGRTYYIRVVNPTNTITTSGFNICLQALPKPANDTCANATQLNPTSNCVTTSGTFSGALLDGAAPSCANQASQDVWYKFTATEQTMSIFIERPTTNSTIFLAFEIYENSCTTGNQFKCIAPSQVYVNYFNTDFIIGRTYYIRVVNPTNTITTSGFNICLQALPKPANDTCANATQLNPTSNCVTTSGTFSGALLDGAAPSCANQASQDVWYKFTATEQTMSIFIERPTTNSTIFLAFEIYENSCTTGNQFKCIAPSQVYVNYFNTDFIIGRTYYIRVVNPTNTITTSGFNICLQALPKPANDACANATVLTPNANCVQTSGTFSGALLDGNIPLCYNSTSQDVWYKFTATSQTMSISVTSPTTNYQLYYALEIYEDSCSGNRLQCIAPGLNAVNYSGNNLVIGRTYYVRVVNPVASITSLGFNICLMGPPPANCTPSVAITASASTICQGESVTFNATSVNGGTAPGYQWKVNGNNVGNNSSTYITAALTNGNTVSCVMTSNAACAFPTSVTSNTVTVVVNSVNAQTTTQGNTITATATGATYQWINCGNNQPINGATLVSFTPAASGSYAVIVTQNGCSKTSACVTISILGMDEFEKTSWKIYPNPANQQLNIDLNEETRIVITDMVGKIVQHCDLKSGTNTINVSALTSGMYIIKSSSGTNAKFVKK